MLIEEGVDGVEVECGVLGNRDPVASVVGEIVAHADWYDYSAKYDEGGMDLVVPARISPEADARVRELAVDSFVATECEGMARIDFFVRPDGEVVVNEINTIPGFTSTSVYAKLFEAAGVSYAALLDRLVELALERHERRSSLLLLDAGEQALGLRRGASRGRAREGSSASRSRSSSPRDDAERAKRERLEDRRVVEQRRRLALDRSDGREPRARRAARRERRAPQTFVRSIGTSTRISAPPIAASERDSQHRPARYDAKPSPATRIASRSSSAARGSSPKTQCAAAQRRRSRGFRTHGVARFAETRFQTRVRSPPRARPVADGVR